MFRHTFRKYTQHMQYVTHLNHDLSVKLHRKVSLTFSTHQNHDTFLHDIDNGVDECIYALTIKRNGVDFNGTPSFDVMVSHKHSPNNDDVRHFVNALLCFLFCFYVTICYALYTCFSQE